MSVCGKWMFEICHVFRYCPFNNHSHLSTYHTNTTHSSSYTLITAVTLRRKQLRLGALETFNFFFLLNTTRLTMTSSSVASWVKLCSQEANTPPEPFILVHFECLLKYAYRYSVAQVQCVHSSSNKQKENLWTGLWGLGKQCLPS